MHPGKAKPNLSYLGLLMCWQVKERRASLGWQSALNGAAFGVGVIFPAGRLPAAGRSCPNALSSPLTGALFRSLGD